jgi:beta-mannosidase
MRISLNGNDWQFKDYYGEDWRWRNAHEPNSRDVNHWRQGAVPGSVHHDLWTVGTIPNPYFELNSLLIEWIPARTWVYKKTFQVESALQGQRIQLHFEGVDYEAEFFLNGISLGSHRGMYTPAIFEVSEHLLYGQENLLAVVIESAPHEQPQVGRTSAVRTHKSRMTYWWDFCPRMVHIGIWDEVYLEVTDTVRIEDVFVRPILAPDFQHADLDVAIALDALQSESVDIELTVRLEGEIQAQQRISHSINQGKSSLRANIPLEQPQLWYPNGYGAQPLYDVEVTLFRGDKQLHQRIITCGIRKVELIHNENSSEDALPYTLVVNGRKLYIKGWNWVPLDVMYGVPRPEKLEHLLRLAQSAHVNLLRIWGGGLIEKEAFYNLCDRLGIMVWQEFIQSSSGIDNNAPEDPEFIAEMVKEAEIIIPRKRNHPSLIIWCGGNELQRGAEQPLDDSHPLLAALKATVAQLDPDRIWLATSPTGRVFMNSLENIERDPDALHDVHGPWEYQGVTGQYSLYNQGTSLLHSEFGVEGMTNRKSLDATIASEHQLPVSLENPYWQHLGAWWVKQRMWQATFGAIADVETLRRATQFMQAEGLHYALEADRRRKYHNSGTLPWQFNEPYPMAACTSAVDYYGQAKPAYYAVAHAYEPVHISAKYPTLAWAERKNFEAEIWVNHSHETSAEAQLQIKLIGQSGSIYKNWQRKVLLPVNSAAFLTPVQFALTELKEAVFFLDLVLRAASENVLSENRYIFTTTADLSPLLNVPMTQLTINRQEVNDGWQVNIRNTGNATAFFIWIEDSRDLDAQGTVYFSANHFCLFPQESKTITVSWQNVPVNERNLDIQGWNTQML